MCLGFAPQDDDAVMAALVDAERAWVAAEHYRHHAVAAVLSQAALAHRIAVSARVEVWGDTGCGDTLHDDAGSCSVR